MTTHTYTTSLSWSGSTTDYDTYDRTHTSRVGPTPMRLSADAAFRGDPELTNPEQLLVAAASSCQLLSFLAVAAWAGVEVLAYDDTAEGVMPEARRGARITAITLRPRIVVRGTDAARVEQLVERAHEQCYVANSLTSEIVVEPTVEVAP